jgi:hypothetical protein
VAIASSSPRSWVVGHLEHVDAVELFDHIVTGDEVATHKPDPAIYGLALRRLGVPGSAAIAVEDTPHGVAAAQAAGMFAVAVPNPFVDRSAVAAADLVLGSAAQLLLTDLLLSTAPKHSTPVTDWPIVLTFRKFPTGGTADEEACWSCCGDGGCCRRDNGRGVGAGVHRERTCL